MVCRSGDCGCGSRVAGGTAVTENSFCERPRALIEAERVRERADRILVVSPAIRSFLYDLLHEEIQRLEVDARDRKSGALRAKLNGRADLFRALADELAR